MDLCANLSGFINSSDANSTSASNCGTEDIYSVNVVTHILNSVISALAIFFNGLITACLLKHRSKFPEVIFQQTLCLSVTDLIAGSTSATFGLMLIESINRSFKACAAIFVLEGVPRLAVIINLCFVSIRRWIVLRHASKPSRNTRNISTTRTVLFVLVPWIITCLMLIPIIQIAVTQETTEVNGCVSITVFRKDNTASFYAGFTLVSLLMLTLFYTGSIIALKRTGRQTANVHHGRNQRLQQRAFKHLVGVLIVANITTLPFVVSIVLSASNIFRNIQLLYLSSRIQMLNSAINPVIYSFHITELRTVIKESLAPNRLQCCSCNGTGDVQADNTEVDRY
ncbi:cannabinoid receptor 1-like [Ruditapes philippinarum]|uniref:cannabinoid receptor 1-like n=1 Tax=Ruditapes philippinarum TaxID=129788 RepID=UPI00295B5136|nr:cannabinoid receptor 1-like [Ruditapes philippinarum]